MNVQYVFISYKTEERELAQRIRATLALAAKCAIWWDQDLQTGGAWSKDLDEALRKASCVVVLWSEASVKSTWVQQEAAVAKALGKLLPVRIDTCQIPGPYAEVQTTNLANWNGQETDAEFVKLTSAVRAQLGRRSRVHGNLHWIVGGCALACGISYLAGAYFGSARSMVDSRQHEAARAAIQSVSKQVLKLQACTTAPLRGAAGCDDLASDLSSQIKALEAIVANPEGTAR